ncbi:MAG: hypothetical protein GC160_10860 [Acidobacteria bacterium]|nr:hypothetical protein [Acidobacteriota bacterium]
MRNLRLFGLVLAATSLCGATTLQRLSLEDLVRESVAVVRGRVAEVRTERVGAMIYTVARLELSQVWKGSEAEGGSVEVSSPGGAWQGLEQRFPGAPRLEAGRDYVLFLWAGPSGRIQLTGFSQGVLEVVEGPGGGVRVTREALSEELLLPDAQGPQAASEKLDLSLEELDELLRQALATEASR